MKKLINWRGSIFCTLILMLSMSLSVANADWVPTLLESQIITIDDFDYFGRSIAMDGDTLLGTAHNINDFTNSAVYVFVRSGTTWTQQAVLTPDSGEFFRDKLVLDGDTALVRGGGNCSPYPCDEYIYVFVRSGTTWSLQTKLQPYDGPHEYFGYYMDFEGDTALIGSADVTPDFHTRTEVYPFTRSGSVWTQQPKWIVGDYSDNQFVSDVAISGDVAMVGSYNNSTGTEVHVFNRSGSTWVEQSLLTSDPEQFTVINIKLDGNTAFIGGISYPLVYHYDGTAWIEQPPLFLDEAYSYYLSSADLEGNTLVLGDYGSRAYAYYYNGTTWTQQNWLRPSDNSYNFGSAVAVANGIVAVGGWDYTNGIYIYENAFVPNVNEELLVNSNFEQDIDSDTVPDKWSRKNTVDDKLKCNQVNEPAIAYEGNCAYMLKGGSGDDRKLAQNVNLDLHPLVAGNRIKLTGFYNKQSAGDVLIWIYVNYVDQTQSQAKIKVTKTTSGYQPIPAVAVTLTGTPERVRVVVENKATSGKTWVDGFSLKVVGGSSNLQALPLPQVIPLPESASSLTGN